jgi:hypothetical protein
MITEAGGRAVASSFYGTGRSQNWRPSKKSFLDHQNFFSDFEAKIAPSFLKMAPPLCPFQGGGCKRWYLVQICAPVTTPLRAAAPLAPPLATALAGGAAEVKGLSFFSKVLS